MAKKILPVFIFLSFFYSTSYSQDFLGLSTGNYSGITGVSLQPASIVDSRHKFDLNLFSTGVNYSNNYFLLDKDVLLKFNKNKFDDYASFKAEYLSQASLKTGEKVFFNINNRTQLPLSFMATTGKKSAIALNMQFRTMVQGRGISQDFAELAYNDFYHAPLANQSIDVSGININSLSWAEVGFTYGRVLISSDKHFLKGAITGKYLAGLSSINISSNDLKLQVNNDSTFNFATSNVSYNHNKNADFDQLFNKNFNPDANSFGLDAGLVYEYRGNIDKFKYLKTDDEKSYDALRRDVNKYIFKFGVSLLDVGMFNFNKPANVNSFQGNINNWDIRNANYKTIKDFDTALANRVLPNLNDPRNYNVYLPTALSAQFDVKFVKGLFLNVMSYWPVTLGDEPGKRFDKYGYYSITPRFETRHFGLYIPYTITQRNDLSDYKQHLLGATVRVGPVFLGSSNLGSMLFNNKLKSADVHVGLKIGFTYGKPNKSNRILNSVFKDDKTVDTTGLSAMKEAERRNLENQGMTKGEKLDKRQTEGSMILDYKTGRVYDNPGVKQNITIINNYYYGSTPAGVLKDTIALKRRYPLYDSDSLQTEMEKIVDQRNKAISDSMSKVTTDSLRMKKQQLDSLIKSMQQLQKQMDSTSNAGIEDARDSSVSYNNLQMMERQEVYDSLSNQRDSLQAGRGEALMARTNTYRQYSVPENLQRQQEDSSSDKKKVKSVTDSLNTVSSLPRNINSRVDDISDSLSIQQNQELKRQQQLVRLQDSVSQLSQQYSDLTDSLTRRRNLLSSDSAVSAVKTRTSSVTQKEAESGNQQQLKQMQDSLNTMAKRFSDLTDSRATDNLEAQRKLNESLMAREKSTFATAPLPENRVVDSKEYQRLQEKQDDLYKQYARQADLLSKDIDRLNSRLVQDRRNDRRNNTSYIPVPIPINTSGNQKKQDRVEPTVTRIADTVYVRDSIVVRDTVRLGDSLTRSPSDIFVSRPVPVEPSIDTVFVKEVIKQPTFDYASFPEENVLFDLGKFSVQPIYDKRLNFLAGLLLKNPGLSVRITGHTDSSGSRAINEKLSLQRAEAVADYMLEKGVSQNQIVVSSEAFENPAVTGNTKSARSQNRRVALKLEKVDQQ